MSKLNYKQIISKMNNEGYCNTEFIINSLGNYNPEDSDWNYKDVPHLNIVHKNVEGLLAIVDDNFVGSINFLKIPYIGIALPLIFVNYEVSEYEQVYFSSFGPFMILVETVSEKSKSKTIVKSKFCILSKPIFKFLHIFIKKMVTKNNKVLMSEDIPMRERRYELRRVGHNFYNPNKTYSFQFTEEIFRANVFIQNDNNYVDIAYSDIIDSSDGDIIGKKSGILSFFVKEENGLKSIWPTTCPHEGAKMDKSCIVKSRILCPWHHRRIDRILDFKDEITNIIPSIDFCVEKFQDKIRIYYRNDPQYYNSKPYEIFRKN